MDILPYSLGVDTTDTFDIWRKKTNGIITKITSGSSGANPDVGYPTWITTGDFTINGTGTLNAKDIYCRNIYSGSGTSTGDSTIELGHLRTDNGKAILDFHTRAGSDFDARIKKEGTINGQFSFENNGTGTFIFNQADVTAPFIFSHAQNERLKITNDGVSIGTLSQPKTLTVEGNIIGKDQVQNSKIRISNNDIYEYATNSLTTLSINRLGYNGSNSQFRTTTIYDGKEAELAIFNGSSREVTIGKANTTSSLNVIGSITGTSLIATASGAITGGVLTCTSLTTQSGNISCGNINTSGIYTQTGKTKPTAWGGGVTTFDVYSDGGTIGIGVGGTILASMSNTGVVSGTSVTSTGEISGNTLRTASSLTFGTDVGVFPQNTDLIKMERFDLSSDVTQLRATIGDNVDTDDSFLIGINTTGLPVDYVEKFRVTSGGNVTAAGFIKANGDIVAYNSSDSRLKENVKVIPDALSKVSQLSGVTFDWNDQQTLYSGNDVGVIAQEVEAVLPQIVTTRENGYKAVKYERLVALLIESVKELKVNNEQLQSRIYSLEQHVNI